MSRLLILSIILLAGCATTPTTTTAQENPVAALQSEAQTEKTPVTPALNPGLYREEAADFDRFVRGKLSAKEIQRLEDVCKSDSSRNPFCPTILKPQLIHSRTSPKRRARRWIGRVAPRFSGGKVINWGQLRYSDYAEVIKGTSRSPLRDLLGLKDLALAEEKCPNNAAIAVAANLESHLGEYGNTLELGQLYEKGAYCLNDARDKENMLTRAALFYYLNKEYKKSQTVLAEVVKLEPLSSGRAFYWLYRSQLAQGDLQSARQSLGQLKTQFPFAFHSLIAQITEKEDPGETLLKKETSSTLKRSQNTPILNQLIEQVEILHQYGHVESAGKLLEATIQKSEDAEPEVRLYLAELMEEGLPHSERITLLSSLLVENPHLISRKTIELYFPKAFFPLFEKHSAGLDPYLLLAIARQESAFNPRAISRANARGLLQILPSTRRKLFPRQLANLLDPESNVQVGAKYFTELLRLSQGQIHLALAAYNAGPQRVLTWLKRYPSTEPILFIDLIPYRETRNYVASILRNYYWYRRVHGESTEPFIVLKDYMPTVNIVGQLEEEGEGDEQEPAAEE